MAAPKPIVQSRWLIGEGVEEERFFQALLQHEGVENVQVENYGGKGNLPAYLAALTKRSGFEKITTLGITRDADEESADAFTSLGALARGRGWAAPDAPGQFSVGQPRVGIFILPNNTGAGMLEDLCWQAVADQSVTACVEQYFQCLTDRALALPTPLAKARTHVWLAAQSKPDMRLGEAAEKGYWPFDHPAFAALKAFLHQL